MCIYTARCQSHRQPSEELRRHRNLLSHAISTAEQERQREEANPSGQSPMDSESISFTTRTHCLAEVLPSSLLSCSSWVSMYAALVLCTWPMRMPHPQDMLDGRKMTAAGFEPTQPGLVELESTPLDHSGKLSMAENAS